MDTIEELSNGFINKINEIKERLQGKEGVENTGDDEDRQPQEDVTTLKADFSGFFSKTSDEVR